MTPLSQQLEDKKKELEETNKEIETINEVINNNEGNIDAGMENDIIKIVKIENKLQAEIAILEQAIAEIEKQRQEVLEEIGYKIFSEDEQKSNNVWYKKGWDDNASRINKELQQLNQPKTER